MQYRESKPSRVELALSMKINLLYILYFNPYLIHSHQKDRRSFFSASMLQMSSMLEGRNLAVRLCLIKIELHQYSRFLRQPMIVVRFDYSKNLANHSFYQ